MRFDRLSLHRFQRVASLKFFLLELEVQLLDHSLLPRHWLQITRLSRYTTWQFCDRISADDVCKQCKSVMAIFILLRGKKD